MKNLIKWSNKRVAYLSIWDIAHIKWASVAFGIMISCIFPETLLYLTWKFWLLLMILFLIKPVYNFYFNKNKIKR